jgi:hypothetical protein
MKKVNHLIVLGAAILLAELISKQLEHYLIKLKDPNQYLYVFKLMAMTLFLYYPAMLLSEKVAAFLARKLYTQTQQLVGRKIVGLVLCALLTFGFIYALFFKTVIGYWPFSVK